MRKTATAVTERMPERLARCAFELFAERGFKNVNLDQVAARAGVTKGSLYWHYKNKKDLILAACRHYYRAWQADVNAAIAASDDPLERLRFALSFSVDACVLDRRNRMFTTGIFILMQDDADVRDGWARFYGEARAFYVGLADAAQAAGRLPRRDARREADLMLQAMEGLKLQAGFEPRIADPAERRATVDGLMSVFTGGDTAGPRSPGRRVGRKRSRIRKCSMRVSAKRRTTGPNNARG